VLHSEAALADEFVFVILNCHDLFNIPEGGRIMSTTLTPSIPIFVTSPVLEKQARRGLLVYFALLIPLSIICYVFATTTRNALWMVPGLMWTPAVSSIIARLAFREGVADISFRVGGRRGLGALLVALVLPIGIGLLAYGTGWITGLTPFTAPPLGPFQQLLPAHRVSPALFFLVSLLVTMTYGTLFSIPLAFGEELGWRGYMLTRLIDAGVPKPILLSGLIWCVWHVPLIVAGLYVGGPFLVVSIALFMINVMAFSYVFARLRLATGSIWPCVLLHASWNAIIMATFNGSVTGAMSHLWIGEAGILVCIVMVVIAVVLSRMRWTMIRQLPKRGEPVHEEVLPPALV
jgi:membrane protease YdiL (CAAX protease family)